MPRLSLICVVVLIDGLVRRDYCLEAKSRSAFRGVCRRLHTSRVFSEISCILFRSYCCVRFREFKGVTRRRVVSPPRCGPFDVCSRRTRGATRLYGRQIVKIYSFYYYFIKSAVSLFDPHSQNTSPREPRNLPSDRDREDFRGMVRPCLAPNRKSRMSY